MGRVSRILMVKLSSAASGAVRPWIVRFADDQPFRCGEQS
jgi:hypothetical protein